MGFVVSRYTGWNVAVGSKKWEILAVSWTKNANRKTDINDIRDRKQKMFCEKKISNNAESDYLAQLTRQRQVIEF